MSYREPLLKVDLADLRPTQITVGYAEVVIKRAQWAAMKTKERERQLAAHCFPAVKGPQDRFYIVDHHHLGQALREEGLKRVWVMQLADLSQVEGELFWRTMEFHRWTHPFDHKGKRRGYDAIPASIDDLRDDPYRSLAGCVRGAGGYAKDTQPYAEFLWADFFRSRIEVSELQPSREGHLVPEVVHEAVAMATGQAARYLPGWSGPLHPQR
ncbi:MAG: chromosome partitioning protein ParB [Rhizobacter sp.]|nr:chromosome partitioning protein ParB [Rhizobacter sp.]